MRAANQIQIIGNLGGDPKEGKATNGSPFLFFSLAEDGGKKLNEKKERVKKTRWHDCVAWGENLVGLLRHLKKGERLLVQGQLDYDVQSENSIKYKRPKIVIHDFIYMDPKES
ncbi:MAG: single-stranded DNA-binding protein [Maricaulaceae bacterium]